MYLCGTLSWHSWPRVSWGIDFDHTETGMTPSGPKSLSRSASCQLSEATWSLTRRNSTELIFSNLLDEDILYVCILNMLLISIISWKAGNWEYFILYILRGQIQFHGTGKILLCPLEEYHHKTLQKWENDVLSLELKAKKNFRPQIKKIRRPLKTQKSQIQISILPGMRILFWESTRLERTVIIAISGSTKTPPSFPEWRSFLGPDMETSRQIKPLIP